MVNILRYIAFLQIKLSTGSWCKMLDALECGQRIWLTNILLLNLSDWYFVCCWEAKLRFLCAQLVTLIGKNVTFGIIQLFIAIIDMNFFCFDKCHNWYDIVIVFSLSNLILYILIILI